MDYQKLENLHKWAEGNLELGKKNVAVCKLLMDGDKHTHKAQGLIKTASLLCKCIENTTGVFELFMAKIEIHQEKDLLPPAAPKPPKPAATLETPTKGTLLSDFIKQYRKDKKLSQKALGKLIGVSDATICYIEKGKPIAKGTYNALVELIPVAKEYTVKLTNKDPRKYRRVGKTPATTGISPEIIRAKLFKYNDRLGLRFQKIRKELDIPTTEFSKLFNITVEELMQMEAGKKISLRRYIPIARTFGVTQRLILDNVVEIDPFGNPIGE